MLQELLFTFHYGSILIEWLKANSNILPKFTFHYGSILIYRWHYIYIFNSIYIPLWFYSNIVSITYRKTVNHIYIPLWFYSNINTPAAKITTRIFTFHYGSILIETVLILWLLVVKFTFHYGSILIDSRQGNFEMTISFTFHYGSILIKCMIRYIYSKGNLHSTMVLF